MLLKNAIRFLSNSHPIITILLKLKNKPFNKATFLFSGVNTFERIQGLAAKAVAYNRMYSVGSAINDDNDEEFQKNIKPRLLGLSPPSNSILAKRRAASMKSHSSTLQSKEAEASEL